MEGLIGSALIHALTFVVGHIFNLLATLTGALLGFAVYIFNWVASDNFISLSYTNAGLAAGDGNFNVFIDIGWTLTRDLTNIFFVLGLVVIGLSTALRINDYQAKRILPKLIIIALLINFTPILLGLIVDAANIAMNFFIQGGFNSGISFANYTTNQWANISNSLLGEGSSFWDPAATKESIAAATGALVLIFFNLIAALLYLLFAFIFIFRYVAIWTLVILSPLAFAAYIFPTTKRYFTTWWNQFIQWTIIGVFAAFFLYLGDHFIRLATNPEVLHAALTGTEDASIFALLLNNFLPYGIALVFLFLGFMMTMNSSAMGSKMVIGWGKSLGRGMAWGSKVAGTALGTALGRKTYPKIENLGEKLAEKGKIPKEINPIEKSTFSKIMGATGLPKIARFGARTLGTGLVVGGGQIKSIIGDKDSKDISTAENKAKDRWSAHNLNDAKKALLRGDMNSFIGYLKGTIKNGDTDDIVEAIEEKGMFSWKDMSKAYKVAAARGTPHRRLFEKAFLGRMDQLGVSDSNQEKIYDRITGQDIASDVISWESLNPEKEMGRKNIDNIMMKGDSQLVSQLLRLKKHQREPIWNHIKGKGKQWFIDNKREDILTWSISSPARGLGLSAIDGVTENEINELVTQRDIRGKDEKDLKERLENVNLEIKSTKDNRRRNKLISERGALNNEMSMIRMKKSGTDLYKEKVKIENEINILKGKRINPKDQESANRQKNDLINKRSMLSRIEKEIHLQEQRGGEIPKEDIPIPIKIREIEQKEKELKEKLPNLYHLAKDKAKNRLESLVREKEKLQAEFKTFSPERQTIEEDINKRDNFIKVRGEDIKSIQKEQKDIENKKNEWENNLKEYKTVNDESGIQNAQNNIDVLNAKIKELQSEISINEERNKNDRDTISKSMKTLESMKEMVPPKTKLDYAKEDIYNLNKEENNTASSLARQKASKETFEAIKRTKDKLERIKEDKRIMENEAAGILKIKELEERLDKEILNISQNKKLSDELRDNKMKEIINKYEREIEDIQQRRTSPELSKKDRKKINKGS